MPNRDRRRARTARVDGRRRAAYLAHRFGVALRASRLALRLTQAEAGDRAGVAQSFWSRLERGLGTAASLETLAACAAAVGTQLAAFIEARPGADLPRDIEHLRRQQLVISVAAAGGWTARPERPIDPSASRSRSIDVLLERGHGRERVVVEIVDLLADAGDAMRNLQDKVAAVRRERPAAAARPAATERGDATERVAGLLVLRATRRNRELVRELRGLLATRFPASSAAWLAALRDPRRGTPAGDGFVWSTVGGDRLIAARLG